MTVILVIHVTRTSLAQPVLSAAQPLLGARVTVAHHVVSKTDQLALLIVIHVRHAMTVHHALLIVTHAHRATRVTVAVVSKIVHNVIRTSLVQPVLSAAQPLLGTRAQTHADHASLMTAHASSTATTATTAPTVVQTALTV
jgi:hypothetical protein